MEPGETPRDALVRELHEELGIQVQAAYPWVVREYVYEHAHVRLHFFRVPAWHGELRDHVHTALEWQQPGLTTVTPMLPANAPVLAALALPDFYGITHAGEIGAAAQLAAIDRALASGLRLVQLREPLLAPAERGAFAQAAVALCHRAGTRVLVNGDSELARASGADGIHLPAAQLVRTTARPDFPLVGASCHTREDLSHAAGLALDFAVLGPVLATATHPGRAGIGWTAFAAAIADCALPVYALGGMARTDLAAALTAGAQGIAAIRAAWDQGS